MPISSNINWLRAEGKKWNVGMRKLVEENVRKKMNSKMQKII